MTDTSAAAAQTSAQTPAQTPAPTEAPANTPAPTPADAAKAAETSKPQTEQSDRTFSQSDVERLIGERLARERSKYTDYEELQRRSEQLKLLEDRDKTEAQKAAEEAAAAKWDLENTQLELRRIKAAHTHSIPEDYLPLLTGKTDEELTASAERIGKLVADSRALEELRAAEKNGKPSNGRPTDALRPGASPAETPVREDAYPESWLPRARGGH